MAGYWAKIFALLLSSAFFAMPAVPASALERQDPLHSQFLNDLND